MNRSSIKANNIPQAMITGTAAIVLTLILLFMRVEWAVLPLLVFVIICLFAPFFPSWGFFLPVISRGHTGRSVVSLTFDDGPDPLTTGPLLALLKRHDVKACFFVIGKKVEKYGQLVSAIIEEGHEIGNHSYSHDTLLMLRSYRMLSSEIESTQNLLQQFCISPLAFRPPMGITNPRLALALRHHGMYSLMFSCRGGDFGNRHIKGLSQKILKKVNRDHIILLHDTWPRGNADVELWLHEIDRILLGLKDRGLKVIPLGELVAKPIMIRMDNFG
jgi:peptidoglycan/xylan/chitin deacetylase (PgdA/CDA1 family)